MGCTTSTAAVVPASTSPHRRHRGTPRPGSKEAAPVYLHNYEDLNLNVPQTNSSVMNAIRGLNSKQISPAVLPIPEDYPDHHSREPSWRGSPGHSIPEEDEESCYDSVPAYNQEQEYDKDGNNSTPTTPKNLANRFAEQTRMSESLVVTTESHHLQDFFGNQPADAKKSPVQDLVILPDVYERDESLAELEDHLESNDPYQSLEHLQ